MKIQAYLFFKYLLLFTAPILASKSPASAQSERELTRIKVRANDNFNAYRYYRALPDYLRLDSLDGEKNTYIYPIAACFVMLDQNEKAIPFLLKALETPERYPSNLFFFAGRAFHLEHRFEEAIANYDIYKTLILQQKKKDYKVLSDIYREIEMCRYGLELISKPIEITIKQLGPNINSLYPDYAPVITADESEIIFTSSRPSTNNEKEQTDGHFFEEIYISEKDSIGNWLPAKKLDLGIERTGNLASISLTPDGHKLLIYQAEKEFWPKNSSGNLFVVAQHGDHWQAPEELAPFINTNHWESSACFSADEEKLFFTSNKPGGTGGTDIYVCNKLEDGTWDLPKNLGPRINTAFDEDSPYLHPDGKTLYFSSNGHRTMGGYDIFASTYNEETKDWNEPQNLGYPINSAHDDTYFSWSADGNRIYFSSIRPETHGNRDIYYGVFHQEERHLLVLTGIVVDSITQKPIEAVLKLKEKSTQGVHGTFYSSSLNGKYLIVLSEGKNYDIIVEAPSHQTHIHHLDLSKYTKFERAQINFKLQPAH